MAQAVLLGDPRFFRIKSGNNPHTRTRWGRRKRVVLRTAVTQWRGLKSTLEGHGVSVHVIPAVQEEPGTVFPANAGFRYGGAFHLSNLNPTRRGEREHYRGILTGLGLQVRNLESPLPFEGEADFIPVGDPSGDPAQRVYLFTYGQICRPHWAWRWGFPPYRWATGFRSDRRILPVLQSVVGETEILPLQLIDPAHYHGDTVVCPFGPRGEYLLVYLEALSSFSRDLLRHRLRERLIPLDPADGRGFAANSFQVSVSYFGKSRYVLLMPDGLSERLYGQIRSHGVIPCPVDVSEFLEKGGGAVKCLLLNLTDGPG